MMESKECERERRRRLVEHSERLTHEPFSALSNNEWRKVEERRRRRRRGKVIERCEEALPSASLDR